MIVGFRLIVLVTFYALLADALFFLFAGMFVEPKRKLRMILLMLIFSLLTLLCGSYYYEIYGGAPKATIENR